MKEVTRWLSDDGEMYDSKEVALEEDMWHKVRMRVEMVFPQRSKKAGKSDDLSYYFQGDIVYHVPMLLQALGIEWDEEAFMAREFTNV